MKRMVGLLVAGAVFAQDRLDDADPAARVRAARALAERGAADAVPALVECLIDERADLRAAAAHALGRAGPAAAAALPELARLLEDGDASVRTEALRAMVRIGDATAFVPLVKRRHAALAGLDAEADPILVTLLADPSWHVRQWVARHPRLRKDLTAAWVERLAAVADGDPSEAVRVAAVRVLARLPDARAVPFFRRRLAGEHRALAVGVLGRRRDLDAESVRALVAVLDDPAASLRARAALGLRHYATAKPALARRMADAEPLVRSAAAAALAHLGAWDDAIAAELVASAVRYGVAPPYPIAGERRLLARGGALHRIGQWEIDRVAIAALRTAGARALPHLERKLAGASPGARMALVHALGHIGREAAPVLVRARDAGSRAAAFCLAHLGDPDGATIRVLVECLADPEWQAGAEHALLRIGERAVPLLEARLRKVTAANRHVEATEHGVVESQVETGEMRDLQDLLARIRAGER